MQLAPPSVQRVPSSSPRAATALRLPRGERCCWRPWPCPGRGNGGPRCPQPAPQRQHLQALAAGQQGATPAAPAAAAPAAHTYRQDSDVLDDEVIKVVGLGQRGISATARLIGNASLQGAEFWVLDTDAKVLGSSAAPNRIQVPQEEEAQLSADQLSQLAGEESAAAAAAASKRPGSPVNTCGVVFLLAGAGGIPGGSTLLLQVAAYLRRTGFFVVVALTRPFDFEGRRKLEEADALIEALQDVAHLVVVVPQGVLTRASAELTVNEASAIADNTLETSCRAILWALGVPEVLRASGGAMLWHGRDLRQYRRLLSPPLEVLLTCPGVGGLGRGLASLPVASLPDAGLASGLSTLAEDAVAAAVESPFLESAMPCASGVLCVLSLPARVLSHDLSVTRGALNDPEKYAIRAAVQVAAMTVRELAGPHCEEVVVCAHVRPDWPHTDPSLLCLEATLLVLEDPAAAEEKEEAAASSSASSGPGYPFMTPPPAAAARHSAGASSRPGGPILQSMPLGGPPQQPKPQQPKPQQPGSTAQRSNWSAMSAIAGGSAAAAVGQYRGPRSAAASSRPPAAGGSSRPQPFNFFAGSPPQPASTSVGGSGGGSGRSISPGRARAAPRAGSPRGPGQQAQPQQQQQPQQQAPGGDAVTWLPRMPDKHVDAMVAQSLDLPPTAARWRHHQRRQSQGPAPRRATSHFPLAVVPWSSGAGGEQDEPAGVEGLLGSQDLDDAGPQQDVRSRVAGMLQQERRRPQASWDEER